MISNKLPHNFLAEQAVLSILINYPKSLGQVETILSQDLFYIKEHQIIYLALMQLHEKTALINFTTLVTYLQDNNILQKKKTIKILVSLIKKREPLIYLKSYLALLNEKFLRRRLIKLGETLIEAGYITQPSIGEVITKIEQEMISFTQQQALDTFEPSANILMETLKEIQFTRQTKISDGYLSTFHDLDSILQGFHPTDLIVLAGRPAMGKTALALNFTKNIVEYYKKPVIFFSLEMSKKQLIYRLLSMESYVDSNRLKLGRITKTEWLRVLSSAKYLSELPLFIEDNPNLTLLDIKNKIKQILLTYQKIALIVIDYLQLIKLNFKLNNRVQEISYITRTLKSFAKEFDLPILTLSQLSRNVESRVNKRPVLSDLRESGCITPILNGFSWTGYGLQKMNFQKIQKFQGKKPTFSINKKLSISANHRILFSMGWTRLKEITYEQQAIFVEGGGKCQLQTFLPNRNSIFYTDLKSLYDYTIPYLHNYFLNNQIYHNSIEQDSDVVLLIYRDAYYKSTKNQNNTISDTELIIAKHRNGPVGFIELVFDAGINKFFSN